MGERVHGYVPMDGSLCVGVQGALVYGRVDVSMGGIQYMDL
jgi:hypothetical protein